MEEDKNMQFNTYEEAADWFESNDMTDYKRYLKPVNFEFDLRKNRNWVELEREVAAHLRKIAIEKKVPTRILVNKILKDRLQELR